MQCRALTMRTIRVYSNHLAASFAVSLLQTEGFDAVLLDEGSFLNGYGPMRLQVPAEQAAEAVDFLHAFHAAKPPTAI